MINSWPWRPLGELFEIGVGKTMSAAARKGPNKTPFLRTSNVLWDQIDLSSVDEMSIPEHELPAKLLRPGDLLVCEGGEIGRASIWNGERKVMSFQNHVHRLRPIVPDIEPRFYVYFLQSAFTQLRIFEGAENRTTIPNLSRSRLAALTVPQPSVEEQRAIATALSAVKAAIEAQDRILTITRELELTAMRMLFTYGLINDLQPANWTTAIPPSWKKLPISAIGDIITGCTPSTNDQSNYAHGTTPFITPGDIEHGLHIEFTEKHISQSGLNRSRPIRYGTTCFVSIGATIGKVGYSHFEIATTNQQINAIVPNCRYDPLYTFYLMVFWSKRIKAHASPSTVPILSKGTLEAIQVLTTTDMNEQRSIAAILKSIGSKTLLHRRMRKVLHELFQTLLHELMTGNARASDLGLRCSSTING